MGLTYHAYFTYTHYNYYCFEYSFCVLIHQALSMKLMQSLSIPFLIGGNIYHHHSYRECYTSLTYIIIHRIPLNSV